ncbi:MAG TPA: HD domain-containing protein, partial [Nitriliruptorales bacterium]
MTDVPTPSRRALAAARPLLRSLSSARQVYALYPAGHPNREHTIAQLLEQVRDLHAVSTGDPVLFVARHSFYLGPTLLARESLSLFRLVTVLEDAGVEALEFTHEADTGSIDRLMTALQDARTPPPGLRGILVNRIRPKLSGQQAIEVRMSDLRRAYAQGLQHLREQSLRVAAGQPVDLEGATATVESLAAEVIRDPAHALLLTTMKSFDEYTYYHMVNVCLLSLALGTAIGLREDQVVALGIGALLHDVGKVVIPDDVLNHVGKLSEEQWR